MFIFIYPFWDTLILSFSDAAEANRMGFRFLPKFPLNLEAYKKVFAQREFLTAAYNSVWRTVVGTLATTAFTFAGAFVLAKKSLPFRKAITMFITITMFFGGGMVPTYLTVSKLGLVDTRWAMLLPGMISTWNLIVMRSFFIAYPQEIIESGMIDGLRDPGVFLRLVLPTSKAALATIGLYYAVGYWNSYMNARIYIRDESLYPVQNLLAKLVGQLAAEDTQDSGTTITAASIRYASIVVVITPIMCVYPFIQKYFVKGVMVGSIKG